MTRAAFMAAKPIIERYLVQAEMAWNSWAEDDEGMYDDAAVYLSCQQLISTMESIRIDRMYYHIPYGVGGYPPPMLLVKFRIDAWRKWIDERKALDAVTETTSEEESSQEEGERR